MNEGKTDLCNHLTLKHNTEIKEKINSLLKLCENDIN